MRVHDPVRVLFLADSHLGFDLPLRPRVRRRRRGHDFQANYEAALEPALRGEVDLVVHGGDVFHRSRVPPSLARQALEPLVGVADGGVPVIVVPGNHERGRIPDVRFGRHPRVHVFDGPRWFRLEVRGARLGLLGFPFQRGDVRARFPELIRRTGWRPRQRAIDLLCMHQCVEGARVGPNDFTFTRGADVVRAADLPVGVVAVLSGHIHRHQVLTRDLRGRRLPAPVLYPGSVERTSVAEKDETKGYLLVELVADAEQPRAAWRFRPLPTRPFVLRELPIDGLGPAALEAALRVMVAEESPDAVLRIRTRGTAASQESLHVLSAAHLRTIAPSTMNLEVRDAAGGPGWAPRATLSVQTALDL